MRWSWRHRPRDRHVLENLRRSASAPSSAGSSAPASAASSASPTSSVSSDPARGASPRPRRFSWPTRDPRLGPAVTAIPSAPVPPVPVPPAPVPPPPVPPALPADVPGAPAAAATPVPAPQDLAAAAADTEPLGVVPLRIADLPKSVTAVRVGPLVELGRDGRQVVLGPESEHAVALAELAAVLTESDAS